LPSGTLREHTYGRPLTVGDRIPQHVFQGLDGTEIQIPDGGNLVHLQLRRFAGCPICNLHLRSVIQRKDEIASAGIHEVVVFHSTREELQRYVADLPLDTLADPKRELYREFAVERSAGAVLNPRLWPRFPRILFSALRNVLRGRGFPPLRPEGGQLGLPADILISPDGRVVAVKYGAHAYDQWSVDELLEHAGAANASGRAAG
jgi:peroxiredoxin